MSCHEDVRIDLNYRATTKRNTLDVREVFDIGVRYPGPRGEETILRHADVASNCRGRIVESAVAGRGAVSPGKHAGVTFPTPFMPNEFVRDQASGRLT